MNLKVVTLSLVSALFLTVVLAVGAWPVQEREDSLKSPIKLVGAISAPGNHLRFDISWVDEPRARYYLAESGNSAVDVFDAEKDRFLGRITPGFKGLGGGSCGPIEGMGPSGVLVTPDNHLWVADFPGKVWGFDLNKAQPPFGNLSPMAPPISTGAKCRADEIGYDPKDHVIIAGNPGDNPPFATFISADPPFRDTWQDNVFDRCQVCLHCHGLRATVVGSCTGSPSCPRARRGAGCARRRQDR